MLEPFVLILIAIISVFIYEKLTRNNKKLKKIRLEWDTGEFISLSEDFNSISSYWSNRSNDESDYVGVDQLTWNDLAMDEVFEKLNYTQSTVGSEYLFNQLRDIRPANQECHEELYELLANNQSLREEILLILSRLGKQNYTNSSSFFHSLHKNELKHSSFYGVLSLLPLVSIPLLFFNLGLGISFLTSTLLINAIVYYKNKSNLEHDLFTVAFAAAIIETGKELAAISHLGFTKYRTDFKSSIKPIKKIIKFNKITSIGRGGSGALDAFFEYFRIIFLLDFISYNRITQTIALHQKEYRRIWLGIGQLDAASAIVFYRNKLDSYCIPTFGEEEELEFTNMTHPLLKNAVPNTSNLGKSTLITGSNASGKSTYIKGVAINAILAQTINTAIADSWSMKPSSIITSMAIQDNLLEGDSYFIAEIKSLKRIITFIDEGKSCISFIDEILKGTNTIERIAASAAIMEWLALNKGVNILASHDIELTEITGAVYSNYHFRESIEKGIVQFDYKIHSGSSQTRNAIKLLEMLNYPPTVTSQANAFAKQFTESREWELVKDNPVY